MASDLERTFDVGADCPRFQTYVNNLRYELRDRTRPAPLFDGLYLLRPYTTRPQQWLRLRMVDGDTAIVVMIRMDNLYMVGFRQEGRGARTWEFGTRPRSGSWQGLIPGSEPLGFGGGYNNDGIGSLLPEPPPGQSSSRQPDLGPQQLTDGIRGLATYQGARRGEEPPPVRLWLRTIVVTIIESIRSQQVCALVSNLITQERRSGWLTGPLILIIKNWDKICECVIHSANDPDIPELYRYLRRKGICGNTYEARQVVAILYRGPSNTAGAARREKRSAAAVDDVPAGLTFFEVSAVVILDIDCATQGDLYGKITVDDGLDPEVLFCRDRSETQSVGPGGVAELTGPKRAIWGYDEVVFDVDLSHASRILDMSPDVQISKGQMVWNTNERPVEEYNKAQEHVVEGKYGAVKICYAVITNAVVATVVVDLTNNAAALYGSITAATSVLPDKIKLFNRDWNHAVATRAGQSIPLLRNVLVVQLGSSLKINADIWDRGFLPDMSPPDHKIDKGEAEFDAALAGTACKVITGRHGEATVRVTWSRT